MTDGDGVKLSPRNWAGSQLRSTDPQIRVAARVLAGREDELKEKKR